jgi:hypothetical protein
MTNCVLSNCAVHPILQYKPRLMRDVDNWSSSKTLLTVLLPNGTSIQSKFSVSLPVTSFHSLLLAHVFDDDQLSTSLISLGLYCNIGCTAHFDITQCVITFRDTLILSGTKKPHDPLKHASLPFSSASATICHSTADST